MHCAEGERMRWTEAKATRIIALEINDEQDGVFAF